LAGHRSQMSRCRPPSAVATFLIERYAGALTAPQLAAAGRAAERRAREADPASRTRYLGSILVASDEMALCLFEGDSAELLRRAVEGAGLSFERIVEAVPVNGPWARTEPER
jgi:hypothetical protein